jgi:hypothetical protein
MDLFTAISKIVHYCCCQASLNPSMFDLPLDQETAFGVIGEKSIALEAFVTNGNQTNQQLIFNSFIS